MTTRYLCVHCGSRFSLEDGESLRCPSCMRKGGLEKLVESAERPRRKGGVILAAVAVLALVGGGYAFWASRAPSDVEGEPPLEPLETSDVRGYMQAAGVVNARYSDLLEASEAAEGLARHARGESAEERARALARHFASRRESGAFEPWSLAVPRPEELRTQAEVAAALARDGGEAHLYPLELAALAVAALRSEDVPAMLAEVWAYPGEQAPLDPSGQLGYFAVAVYPDEAGEGTPVIVDVYGGREAAPAPDAFRVLTDVQAVSAALVVRAQHALHVQANGGQALGVVDDALKLDARSPSARVTRAMVLMAAQGFEEAKRELESAASIRGDAPRRLALASIHVLERDLDRAEREIRAALEERPGYGVALVRLAALKLEAGETTAARESLEEAERLEAGVPELPLLFAQYHVVMGEHDLARARARETVERFGSWQAQLMAAQVFRATGDEGAMRGAVQAALAAVPEERRDRVREQIAQSMGDAALEPPPAEEEAEAATPTAGALELRLGAGSEPAAPEGELDLGADAEGSEDGPVMMMGDPSSYRLLGPNDRLQLRLGGQ